MPEHLSSPRFDGAATGALHARRASAEYVDRSIRVRVGAMSAIYAMKDRLALAALSVDGTAFGTRLRGVGGVDEVQPAAPIGEFVFELSGENAPALFKDRSVQPTLSAASAGHLGNLQIFNGDGREPPRDVGRTLMQPVRATIGNSFCSTSESQFAQMSSFGASLRSRHISLKFGERFGPISYASRHGQDLTIGEGQCRRNATIDADRARCFRGHAFNWAHQYGEPAIGAFGHSYRSYILGNGSIAAQLNRHSFGQIKERPLLVERYELALAGPHSERTMSVPLAKSWEAATGEKCSKTSVEVTKRIFQDASWWVLEPRSLRLDLGHLFALTGERYAVATLGTELAPPVPSLLKSEIIGEPCGAGPFVQPIALACIWVNPEAQCSVRHRRNLPYQEFRAKHFATDGGKKL